MKELETKRLLLRKFNFNDAQDMFDTWASDPEVCKYLTWNPHTSVEITKQILQMWEDEYKLANTYRYAIVIKENNELIGAIDVVEFLENNPVIGYCIGKRFWNKGYVTEAFNEVIRYLFDEEKYDNIIISAHVDNKASIRVIEKAGFSFTHQEDKYLPYKDNILVKVNFYIKSREK